MTKINHDTLGVRTFDPNETLRLLQSQRMKFFSWGGQAFTQHKGKWLRFKVNGHHHKGHVYITLNGADLYDVTLTTTKGTIVKEMTDIYFDELVDRIDVAIERIPEYEN